jgi:MFS family permease
VSEAARDLRQIRRTVQIEAAAWGILTAVNNAFIIPLLVSRGAGPLALGIYSSGANLFGFGSGWAGPRLAARIGSVSRATLLCLTASRLVFLGIPISMIATDVDRVSLLVGLILLWALGEGLALPLWTAFLTGLVKPEERGRWLALRATAATAASACLMIAITVLFQMTSKEAMLPAAYALAAVAGLLSLWQLRRLFRMATPPPLPVPRSVRALPADAETRRFLAGVVSFWFGASLIGPVLTPYIIRELHAPTSFFALLAVVSAATGVVVQRHWGRLGDHRGARRVLLWGGLGAGLVPAIWAVVPVYWLGFAIEVLASGCWAGHTMGLTLRAVELAKKESDRPNLLALTSLAQGVGAFASPLLASLLVGLIGTIPILLLSSVIRIGATLALASAPGSSGHRAAQ